MKRINIKQMNIKLLALSLGVTFGIANFTQAQQTMGLKDCINYGLQHNSGIKRAQLDLENNKARVMEGVSAYLPQIQAQGTGTDNLQLQTMLMPPEFGALAGQPGVSLPVKFGKQFNINGNIYGQQTIYDQTYISSIQAARESNNIFRTQIVKSEEDVILGVASLFYATQINAEQVKLLESNLKRVTELEKVTKVSVDNGFAKKVDHDRLVVNKANLETNLQNAKIGNAQQLRALKFQMGMPLDAEIVLQPTEKSIVETHPFAETFSHENNVDFKLLETNKKVNKILHTATLVGYVPSLAFTANYGQLYQADDLKFAKANWTPFSAIGLKLTVPIFDGLQKHWKSQQQKIQLQQIELDQNNLKEGLKVQNQSAQDKLTTNILAVQEKKNNMDLAEEIYKSSEISFQNGMASMSDLLQAENELREAQFNYLNALFQIKIAELELLKTSGNIHSIINQ